MKKILFMSMIVMAISSVFAQHNHNKDNSKNITVLFTTQNDQYSATVESETDQFLKDSIYTVNLQLSTSSTIEPGSVKLNVPKSDNTKDTKQMELIDSKYTTKVKFESEGKHAVEFIFNLVGSTGIITGSGFSFIANVKNSSPHNMSHSDMNHHDMKHNEGMMGMSSTAFWLIMGGVMAGMMAVIMILSSHK